MTVGSRWNRITHEGQWLWDVGINPDGELHNPRGYPPDTVRAAITAAEARPGQRW